MAATQCKGLGSRLSIEPNIFGCLSELEDYISSYFNVQKSEFDDSNNQIVLRDLVYINKTSDFVVDMLKSRVLNPTSASIRISFFFKISSMFLIVKRKMV